MNTRKRSIGDLESRILRFLADVGEEALPGIANNLGERATIEQRSAILKHMVDALDTLVRSGFVDVFRRGSERVETPEDIPASEVRAAVEQEVAELPWIDSLGRWGFPQGYRGQVRYLAVESTSKGRRFLEQS